MCHIPAFAANFAEGDGGGFCLCHPAPVQLHYLAAGTQTGGSHSLGLFISETLSFWGPKASASTSVRGRGGEGEGVGEEAERAAQRSGAPAQLSGGGRGGGGGGERRGGEETETR